MIYNRPTKEQRKTIFARGIIYRVCSILFSVCFSYWFLVWAIENLGTIGTAVAWNALSMCFYFTYHYFFAGVFESEGDNKNERE